MNNYISPSNINIHEIVTETYDESQLLELLEFNGSIDELDIQYPIECMREYNGVYRVSYLGDENVAVLLFDNFGNKITANIYRTSLKETDFNSLTEGQSLLKDVRNIDSNGEYLFLYSGRNDTPKISSHYTKDGYLLTIEYDITNVIKSINRELI